MKNEENNLQKENNEVLLKKEYIENFLRNLKNQVKQFSNIKILENRILIKTSKNKIEYNEDGIINSYFSGFRNRDVDHNVNLFLSQNKKFLS